LAVPNDGLEELRGTFLARLKDKRQRLLDLGAALAEGKMDRVPVLDELRSHAHRMSGAAAILDLRGLAALARTLELAVEGMAAAERALMPRAENSDRVMFATLQALIHVIGSLDEPSRELRLHGRIETPPPARRILTS
jgi:HPt (histidine-containing phosphotransfer) domain-containing protein